mgnify:CR=1 FL=1
MRLPIFYILGMPIHVWLGILLALLIFLQMAVGKRIIKLDHFLWHRRIIPILIIIVLIFHAWYGLSIYWPFK